MELFQLFYASSERNTRKLRLTLCLDEFLLAGREFNSKKTGEGARVTHCFTRSDEYRWSTHNDATLFI